MSNGCCFIATQSTEGAHVTKPNNNFLTVLYVARKSTEYREKEEIE